MNKKFLMLLSISSIFLLLVACGQKNEQTKNTSSKKEQVSSQSKSSRSKASSTSLEPNAKDSSKTATKLWDDQKDKQLQEFISNWQGTMGQSYTKYDGKGSLTTASGVDYPDIFTGNGVYLDDQKISIGWSPNGEGPYDYNVVAIYNHNSQVAPKTMHITYLFAFHNGRPIVLVDQSTNGNVTVTVTKNEDVKTNFDSIVSGKGYDTQKFATNKTEEATLKEIALMTYVEASNGAFDLKAASESNSMLSVYYMKKTGRYAIGSGTSISTILFTIDGDTVHYWKFDPNDDRPTYMRDRIEITVPVKELKQKYFATKEQQDMIRKASDMMGNVEEYEGSN